VKPLDIQSSQRGEICDSIILPKSIGEACIRFVVSDREQHPEYFYAEYSGSPFKIVSSRTERLPARRAAYLLA